MTMPRRMDHIDLWRGQLDSRILSDMEKLPKKALILGIMTDRIVSNSEVEAEVATEDEGIEVKVAEIVEEVEADIKTEEVVVILFHHDHKAILNRPVPTHPDNTNRHPKVESSINHLLSPKRYQIFMYHQPPTLLNNLNWLGLNSHLNSSKHFKMVRTLGNRLSDLQRQRHLLLEVLS